jgi:radical SAM superfamily enzyme YgiQ (UPF0313 family)
MELPRRDCGDELLEAGEMARVLSSLRRLSAKHDISSVIACAFDHRTRILPFVGADLRMPPAGVRAIGSAMVEAGLHRTRIVLQQWNKNFRPSEMQLDGKSPDIFMVSSMLLHWAEARKLIEDAFRIDPSQRPLIIVGGTKVHYEPWDVFSSGPKGPAGADIAVTGEEYVLLSLLEVLLSMRARNESMRSVFVRARDSDALECIPGLVYAKTSSGGIVEELVDTGIQRLLGDLDELPNPVHGYRLLEAPSKESKLASRALAEDRVGAYCTLSSIVLTFGCKFRCPYCPIPAYNQRQHRTKSGERVADEMEQIANTFGIRYFFGTDDNFFNDERRALDITETLARRASGTRPLCKIRWGTQATVHDTINMKEHLPVHRRSGLMALWLGVEDITASLVSKGQNKDRTFEAFRLLRANGIFPIPMLMHHDSQPLYSFKNNYGLLNQLKLLRKAGAIYMQVLMLVPAQGSRSHDEMYTSGIAFEKVRGTQVQPHMIDGIYVIASKHPRPWIKQLNIFAGYAYFFNPLRFLVALVLPKTKIPLADAETTPDHEMRKLSCSKRIRRLIGRKVGVHVAEAVVQAFAMWGLYRTYRRALGWGLKLFRGKIDRAQQIPASNIPMRSADGGFASHATPGTPGATLTPTAPSTAPMPSS